jgi:hypothetical protein
VIRNAFNASFLAFSESCGAVSLRRLSRLAGFAPSELTVDAASCPRDEARFEFVGICLVNFFLPDIL